MDTNIVGIFEENRTISDKFQLIAKNLNIFYFYFFHKKKNGLQIRKTNTYTFLKVIYATEVYVLKYRYTFREYIFRKYYSEEMIPNKTLFGFLYNK